MQITSIDDIRTVAGPQIVELSGWTDDEKFVCRLRPVSMYAMLASGNVPNPLIPVVQDLFMGMQNAAKHNMAGAEESKAFMAIAKDALVEPTYEQLEEAGICLTDLQVLEVFFYATRGPRGLASFRARSRFGTGGDGEGNALPNQQPVGDR